MSRFYVDKSQIQNECAVITGEDVNHIKNVLRMREGDGLLLCDGEGKTYDVTIKEMFSDRIICYVTKEDISDTELLARITLFQGLPKKDKMEWIIQKAVELGASEIVPVQMARTIVKLEDAKKEEKKLTRWRSIAESAAKQSGRGIVPVVSPVMNYKEALAKASEFEYNMIPYEKAEDLVSSRKVVKGAVGRKSIGIFIGPEGGIAEEELALALEKGVQPVSLGKRILRTETAGLTALSLVMFELETEKEIGE